MKYNKLTIGEIDALIQWKKQEIEKISKRLELPIDKKKYDFLFKKMSNLHWEINFLVSKKINIPQSTITDSQITDYFECSQCDSGSFEECTCG